MSQRYSAICHRQEGVSLVISFLILSVMLAIILSTAVILSSEIKIIGNIGNSIVSFYAAESGTEQVLYFDRQEIPNGVLRGFCNICNACDFTGCTECSAVNLATDGSNGCDLATCNNCRITYSSQIEEKSYTIDSVLLPDLSEPGNSLLNLKSKGYYRNTARTIEITARDGS